MLNLIKLLLSIKVRYTHRGTELSYKGLTLIVTEKVVTVLSSSDLELQAGRDLMLDAKCYIGIDSSRTEIEALYVKQDAPKQESQSCSI